MRRRASALSALLLATLAAGAVTAEAPEGDAITGKVKLVGSGPAKATALEVSPQEAYDLQGPLVAELARVPGARVAAKGTVSGEGKRRALEIASYEILDVGGEVKPFVGTLRLDGGFVYLDVSCCECTRALTGKASEKLQDKAGAKVWVSGIEKENNVLEVLRSGVLAEAKEQR